MLFTETDRLADLFFDFVFDIFLKAKIHVIVLLKHSKKLVFLLKLLKHCARYREHDSVVFYRDQLMIVQLFVDLVQRLNEANLDTQEEDDASA